ncbi:MAG: peptidylprolyl isomerase, partial [Chitinophagales bacterium]|nr:peptidylprolyl isomerase [Chitinophagales bacterium]
PYFENGSYRIAKLMDRRDAPDSVRARHILIRVEPGSDTIAARKRIDSIYTAFVGGTSFDSLAMQYSDDKGSGQQGGDLGFMTQGKTVKSFNNYLFFEGRPTESKIVKSEFGYHLVQIMESKNIQPTVQVSFISRPLEASSETDKIIFDQATQFASVNRTRDEFNKSTSGNKINKQTAPDVQKNAFQLPGLTSARDVVKWAYQVKLNEVSPVFSLQDNYVVAVLTGIKTEGSMSIDDARPQLEAAVKKEKKAQQIITKLSAAASLNATLESIAASGNQPVKNTENVMFANAYAENIGYEPKVIGQVFSMKENTISKPIPGEQGVFILSVKELSPPTPIADYNSFKQQLLGSLQPRVQYGLTEALKKSVKIQDDRYLFF